LISPLRRSIGFVECNFGRCAGGKLMYASTSLSASSISSRVQHLVSSQAIYVTGAVVGHEATAQLLAKAGVLPVPQHQTLRGIGDNLAVYKIP
jgi:hypothetical protein